MMKKILPSMLLLIFISLGVSGVLDDFMEQGFATHPRLFIDQAGLDSAKAKIVSQTEPYYSQYQMLISYANIALNATVTPSTSSDRVIWGDICTEQSRMARDLALAYKMTNDTSYADKALQFLNIWSQTYPLPGSNFDPAIDEPSHALAVAVGVPQFMWAYDLLYNYPSFSSMDKMYVEIWFRKMVDVAKVYGVELWDDNDYYNGQLYQNHSMAHIAVIAVGGFALGDHSLVEYSIDSLDNPRDFLEMIAGAILMEGDIPRGAALPAPEDGELYDRYRHYEDKGLSYAVFSMSFMTMIAQAAYTNGIDLWDYQAPTGENMQVAYEYHSDYLRLKDSCIKSGYYCSEGETARLVGLAENFYSGIFEVALSHYTKSMPLQSLILSNDRTINRTPWLGYPVLLYGLESELSADIDDSGLVDLYDLYLLANSWGSCTDPLDSDCKKLLQ